MRVLTTLLCRQSRAQCLVASKPVASGLWASSHRQFLQKLRRRANKSKITYAIV
jgi:hypothetical protein